MAVVGLLLASQFLNMQQVVRTCNAIQTTTHNLSKDGIKLSTTKQSDLGGV